MWIGVTLLQVRSSSCPNESFIAENRLLLDVWIVEFNMIVISRAIAMTPSSDQLYQAAMVLSEEERADLAARLLDSLTRDSPSQLHPAWWEEIRRRLARVDSGEVAPIPWAEVKRAAWEAVERDEATPHG